MTSTPPPMSFSGQAVNFQFFGGSPTINYYVNPLAGQAGQQPSQPTSDPSRTFFPSASNLPRVLAAQQGYFRTATSRSHHGTATATTSSLSPHLESRPSPANPLSSLGSPMENLNGFQACTSITHSHRQPSATEGRIHQLPSPATYVRSNVGHERVNNNPSFQDDVTVSMYRPGQTVPFPAACSPFFSFPAPSMNPHVLPMPGADKFDWLIIEAEDDD